MPTSTIADLDAKLARYSHRLRIARDSLDFGVVTLITEKIDAALDERFAHLTSTTADVER